MFRNNIALKGICAVILLLTLGFSQVSLEIKNVDTTVETCSDGTSSDQTTCEDAGETWTQGTLDIYMTNAPGCSYCENSTYNNNTLDWVEKKELCEDPSSGASTWVAYDQITEEECAAIPSLTDAGGWWFNGEVGGFQFELTGINMTDASGGSASEQGLNVEAQGINGVWDSQVLAFSFSGATIPVGSNILLTQLDFSDYDGLGICFGEDLSESDNNTISDWDGKYVAANWGDCYCDSYDCAGVCGGSAIDYNGAEDGCGEMAISQIGSNLPEEFSISQNFPNPFNPVTSITFDVAEMDEVSLVVYDLTGKEVVTLVSGTYTPGTYNVEWDAINNAGIGIVSGMYIYRYISSEKAITRKMLYLK